jgi:hypothetical protein
MNAVDTNVLARSSTMPTILKLPGNDRLPLPH